MDHGEVCALTRTMDAGRPGWAYSTGLLQIEIDRMTLGIGRQRGKKLERQSKLFYCTTEFKPRSAIPRDDAVKVAKRFDQQRGRLDTGQAEQIEPRRAYGPHRIRKPDQRQVPLRRPDFRILSPEAFQRGQRDDQVPDRAWPDQQTAHQPAGRILEISL